MTSALNKLRWSIQHRGVAATLHAAARSLGRKLNPQPERPPHPFDLEHGTDTSGLISGADLASGHPSDRHIEGYAAVPPSRFRNILARWQASGPPQPVADTTFVDIGCGKGRAVLLASEFGFREAVGVELNPALAATAQTNAGRWIAAGKTLCPIRIVQGDAAEFAWPDGPCLIFLFNPFGAAVMERVANRIAEHFHGSQFGVDVLYYKAEQADALATSFVPLWSETTAISAEDLASDPVADPKDETRAYRLVRKGIVPRRDRLDGQPENSRRPCGPATGTGNPCDSRGNSAS